MDILFIFTTIRLHITDRDQKYYNFQTIS